MKNTTNKSVITSVITIGGTIGGVVDYHHFTTIDTPVKTRRKFDVGDIWINGCVCHKCGEFIRSKNRHDYRMCECGSVGVDGGSWYAKRVGDYKNSTNVIVKYNKIDTDEDKKIKKG